MAIKCDVLIIGAGVAGAVSALKLSKSGFNVILIEKQPVVGGHIDTKLDITEETNISHISKELNLKFHGKSNKSKWFSPKNEFLFKSEVNDLFVKRGSEKDSFDSRTVASAVDHGATLLLSSAIEKFRFRNDGFIESAVIRKGRNTQEIFPKYVIGADGSNSTSLKLSGLESSEENGVEIEGFGIVGGNFNLDENITHVFFDSEMMPGGYFFTAKTSKDFGVASIVVNKKRIKGGIKTYFEKFVKENNIVSGIIDKSSQKKYFYGFCRTAPLRKRHKGNFALAGDAARTMDPIFGYGVRPAIYSGFLAAEAIAQSFETGSDLHYYDSMLKKELLADEKFNHFLRQVFDKLDNSDFDFLVESINFLNKEKNFDEILSDPSRNLAPLLKTALRKPRKSSKIALKIVLKKILPFY